MTLRIAILAVVTCLGAATANAQVSGQVSVMADVFPDLSPDEGTQRATELRARVFLETGRDVTPWLRVRLSGYADGLVADRPAPGGDSSRTTGGIVRPVDAYVEFIHRRFDIRAGASRIVWGRLDEFQPTDVVNPLDLSRFLMDSRSEARLSVGLVRGRLFLPHNSTIEGIVVPGFRRGRFDQLDEATSPFNLLASPVPVTRVDPELRVANMQGGARFTTTSGRVDWGVSAYRGLRTFPTVTVDERFRLTETFPRFTMIGGDFETVRGPWGVRGEVAAFVDDEIQSATLARGVEGRSIEAGVGADRRAGGYRIAGNVLWSRRAVNDPQRLPVSIDHELEDDVSFVVAGDRAFRRETVNLRVFAVYDPRDDTTFARGIVTFSLRDNVTLEGSGGFFDGTADDTLGRLARRDFAYLRLRVFF